MTHRDKGPVHPITRAIHTHTFRCDDIPEWFGPNTEGFAIFVEFAEPNLLVSRSNDFFLDAEEPAIKIRATDVHTLRKKDSLIYSVFNL